MPSHEASSDIVSALRESIASALPDAIIEISPGSPGHYSIRVTSRSFNGKSMVQQQQLVYAAIAHLMKGENAPVHAVDRLQTVAAE